MNAVRNLIDQLESHIRSYNRQIIELNEVDGKTPAIFSIIQAKENKEKQNQLIEERKGAEELLNDLNVLMKSYYEQRR